MDDEQNKETGAEVKDVPVKENGEEKIEGAESPAEEESTDAGEEKDIEKKEPETE